ncbi:MAG: hypothetical protein NTX76_01970 [Alphaproteobacteria bacterium]|nr:hypothetical protein [Alphaproteobacteria bacterium]
MNQSSKTRFPKTPFLPSFLKKTSKFALGVALWSTACSVAHSAGRDLEQIELANRFDAAANAVVVAIPAATPPDHG